MLPQTQKRKARNSSRINLLISVVFHALILGAGFYFAARGGLLGEKMKKIAVDMVKEKKPEKPKEPQKPKEAKKDLPKPEPKAPPKEVAKVVPKMNNSAQPPPLAAPPPSSLVAPPVAVPTAAPPPPVEIPQIDFGMETPAVQTGATPIELYKGFLQYTFTSKWDKPDDVDDGKFVAEVRVAVSPDGHISSPEWLKGSGNPKWDDSVRKAVSAVNALTRPPPPNFPTHFIVRFDVQEVGEPLLIQ